MFIANNKQVLHPIHYKTYKEYMPAYYRIKIHLGHNRKLLQSHDDGLKCVLSKSIGNTLL